MDQVIAVFNFNATDTGELSFKKGETLTVLDRKYKQWWLCENEKGMRGVVPCNHIKSLSHSDGTPPGNPTTTTSGKSTPISRDMTAGEVVSQLVAHGCQDLTAKLDLLSFGEYPVSHGGFSDICQGQLRNGTWVAVKALRVSVDSISRNPKHLKNAARELHTWGKCTHPNVIRLFGLAIFRDRIGMVAPWMSYGMLPRYLQLFPGADRLNMCLQICEGLTYLHRIRVIHCDLKGANILVSDEGVPVLTDFGNSSLVDRTLGFTQTTGGPSFTVRWSAPEIIEEITPHTKASDVYALGMTIYETVTGMVPYQGKSETNVIRLVTVRKELPEWPEVVLNDTQITDKLWKLLTKCWSFEPTERLSTDKVTEAINAMVRDTRTTAMHQHAPTNNPNRAAQDEHSETQRLQEEESEGLREANLRDKSHERGRSQTHNPAAAAADKKWYQNIFRDKSRDGRRKDERGSPRERPKRERAKSEGRAREATEALECVDEDRARLADSASAVSQAWAVYHKACSELMGAKPSEGEMLSNLTFYDIPWPVLGQVNSFHDLTSQNIAAFLLSPHHSQDKSPKARLRAAIIVWHPDRFAQKVLSRVAESHRPAIVAAFNVITRIITELTSLQGHYQLWQNRIRHLDLSLANSVVQDQDAAVGPKYLDVLIDWDLSDNEENRPKSRKDFTRVSLFTSLDLARDRLPGEPFMRHYHYDIEPFAWILVIAVRRGETLPNAEVAEWRTSHLRTSRMGRLDFAVSPWEYTPHEE